MRTDVRPAFMAVAAAALVACGRSPVTSDRIERAIEPTFANLVHVQVSWLGLPPLAASEFAVTASCRKRSDPSQAGAGDWECRLVWQSPDRQTVHDTDDVFVATDGCYTATAASDNMPGPVLRARDGREVRNLLYAFDGCFDTTS